MKGAIVTSVQPGLSPEDVGRTILAAYDGLVPADSWGETTFFYNPAKALALGAYFCTLKSHDGENDRASVLNRLDVYRLSSGVTPATYTRLFGTRPARPRKGGIIQGPWPFAALDRLTPHPVYAWMGWLCVLNPTSRTFDDLQPLFVEAYQRARATFKRRLGQ